jgi:hypothetical protein
LILRCFLNIRRGNLVFYMGQRFAATVAKELAGNCKFHFLGLR